LNSVLNGHGNADLSSSAMTSALYLIVPVVYRKDLIHYGMTPVLHWDNSRRKIRSLNIDQEMQNSKMAEHSYGHVCAHMHLSHMGTPNFISLQINRCFF